MRSTEETPANSLEQHLEDICIKYGSNRENLQFRNSPEGNRYLRIGYWQKIDTFAKEELSTFVKENDFDDDDCGTLYYYDILQ